MQAVKYILFMVSVSLAVSCAKKEETKRLSTREIPARLKAAADTCFPHPSEEEFSGAPPALPALDIPFNKPFTDNSVLDFRLLSAEKLWKKLRSDGAKVYVFRNSLVLGRPFFLDKKENCDYYFDLPYVSQADQATWIDDKTGKEPSILGLFLFKEIEGRRSVEAPRIYVHAQTTKWTLMHEALHFYFRRSEVQSPDYIPMIETETKLKAIEQKLDELVRNDDASSMSFEETFVLFSDVFKYYSYSLKQNQLEELTVEYVIAQLYAAKQFGPTLNQFKIGLDYGDKSAKEAISKISGLRDTLLATARKAPVPPNTPKSDVDKMSELIFKFFQFAHEISAVRDKNYALRFQIDLGSVVQKSSLQMVQPTWPQIEHAPSIVDQKFDKIFEKLEKLAN